MNNKIYILIAFIFMFHINKAFAQGCEGDDLTATDSTSTLNVKVFGYIQPEYDYNFTDGNENAFKFRRARIGVTA